MNILFLSITDPADKRATSGIFYSMYEALSVKHDVTWIGAVKFKVWQKIALLFVKILSKVFNFKYPMENSMLYSRFYGQNTKINSRKYDVIFSPMSSSLIANLNTDLPIIYFSDATFKLLVGYYNSFSNIPDRYIQEGNEVERLAIHRSSQVIFTSEWAKGSAINHYLANPSKISVIDFGANLQTIPSRADLALDYPADKFLNLLFIGVNWERKGGDIVMGIVHKLKDSGISYRLIIIGCTPPKNSDIADNVVVIPYLDKNNLKEFQKLYSIWSKSHMFLLPTRADCTPIVFSEAAAFGVPVLTTDTGGIPDVVKHGRNGFLFDLTDGPEQYAAKISELWADTSGYLQLRESCRQEYEGRLSWDTWAAKMEAVLQQLDSNM